jgi:2-polyprenyl-3-methyl-5-hydroxy-6-metoxy-1,4-benzoquinol methylase
MGKIDIYDDYAAEYAALTADRDAGEPGADPVLPRLLAILGPVTGLAVLDAACGAGYVARLLAAQGARVTGMDIAPRLIALARERDPAGASAYQVADLSTTPPAAAGHFDRVVSHLALNDVYDYRGFCATLAAVLKPGGRAVLSLNNPYSYLVRKHISDYFAPGAFSYRGMAAAGVRVHFYQRTLEDYLDAFLAAGLRLEKLADLPTPAAWLNNKLDTLLPPGVQFPYMMILSFMKPQDALG